MQSIKACSLEIRKKCREIQAKCLFIMSYLMLVPTPMITADYLLRPVDQRYSTGHILQIASLHAAITLIILYGCAWCCHPCMLLYLGITRQHWSQRVSLLTIIGILFNGFSGLITSHCLGEQIGQILLRNTLGSTIHYMIYGLASRWAQPHLKRDDALTADTDIEQGKPACVDRQPKARDEELESDDHAYGQMADISLYNQP